MDEFEIEVIGAEPPRKPDGPRKRMTGPVGRAIRALFMRPRALALTGAIVFVLIVGTPHAGWDYECRYRMRPGEPCGSVDYCAYYGIQGRRIVFPDDGETCRIVTFLQIDWQRIV